MERDTLVQTCSSSQRHIIPRFYCKLKWNVWNYFNVWMMNIVVLSCFLSLTFATYLKFLYQLNGHNNFRESTCRVHTFLDSSWLCTDLCIKVSAFYFLGIKEWAGPSCPSLLLGKQVLCRNLLCYRYEQASFLSQWCISATVLWNACLLSYILILKLIQ